MTRLSPPSTPTAVPWSALAARFPEDRQCLASFLALNTAEVLSGEKPANLINIPNRARACGKNLYELWNTYGSGLIEASPLAHLVLRDDTGGLLLYVYSPSHLRHTLEQPGARALLRRNGYHCGDEPETILKQLHERMAREGFPHEIGVFLGYPLKDVAGFMGLARLAFSCQAGWRIYGDPTRSLELARRFRQSRSRMAARLSRCTDAVSCLAASA